MTKTGFFSALKVHIKKFAALPVLIMLLASCASYRCIDSQGSDILPQMDLKDLFGGIARELCSDYCREESRTVLVTDFVDIQTFKPRRHGILMGELMKGSLGSACCSKTVQVEFSSYFKLTEDGLVALTRDPDKILYAEMPRPRESIVGTYYLTPAYAPRKLYVFARRIDMYTGEITKFVSREISMSCWGSKLRTKVK